MERVFEWAKQREESVILIKLRKNYDFSEPLEEQIEGYSNIISSFCKVKADAYVSYASIMFDVDEFDDDMERRKLEKSVLRNVIQLYEAGVEVIELQ